MRWLVAAAFVLAACTPTEQVLYAAVTAPYGYPSDYGVQHLRVGVTNPPHACGSYNANTRTITVSSWIFDPNIATSCKAPNVVAHETGHAACGHGWGDWSEMCAENWARQWGLGLWG